MKHWWQKTLVFTFAFFLVITPMIVNADAAVGDTIITLGEDLTEEQKQALLNEMNATEADEIIYVSNAEEHQYLGSYVAKSKIGTRALSSSKVTLTEKGSGIHVTTNNINWVSEGMYENALITAGVEDADVYVTAPITVSGTAALTGIIKAYEVATDIEIPEEQKQVANEEMVKTAELGESIGVEQATELMNRIKEEIANHPVESEDDLRELIRKIAAELGVELTEEELNGLVSLFMRMKDLNIDWNQVQEQISKVRDNLEEILNREETKGLIESILDFLNQLIDVIRGFFTNNKE